MIKTRMAASRKAGESFWNNWFYAHPHSPWPLSLLPRGEGESVAASWHKQSVLVHGVDARILRGYLTLNSKGSAGVSPAGDGCMGLARVRALAGQAGRLRYVGGRPWGGGLKFVAREAGGFRGFVKGRSN
jgi:hypothetical protein